MRNATHKLMSIIHNIYEYCFFYHIIEHNILTKN